MKKLLSPEAAGLFCSNLHAALTHNPWTLTPSPAVHDSGTMMMERQTMALDQPS